MRTTINLDDHLLQQAKRFAARTGRTLTSVIEDALREALGRRRAVRKRGRIRLPTVKGQGIKPGVNLDSTASVLDLMDEADDPR